MHDLNQLSKNKQLLQELAHADFFDVDLQKDVFGVTEICQSLVDESNVIPISELDDFSYAVARFCQHLEGSIKDELPTAIDYCMRHAIDDWFSSEKVTILHAFTNEEGFYCSPLIWDYMLYIGGLVKPDLQLSRHHVFVGTPRVFKNTTLFLPVLYHEIGHWVDELCGVSNTLINAKPDNVNKTFAYDDHYGEHFADFFAACYIGETIAEILEILSPKNMKKSKTHPATAKRAEFIRKFVRGEEFEELTVFQNALKALGLPELKQRFAVPNISSSFDAARPYTIQNVAELHGILTSAWNYNNEIEAGRTVDWPKQLTTFDRTEVVSSLLERSIMNFTVSNKQQQSNGQSIVQLTETDLQGMSISPLLKADQVEGNSVEMRLGCDFKLSILGQNPINVPESDLADEFALAKYFLSKSREIGGKFTLYPSQVLLAVTLEYLALPDNRWGKLTVLDCHPKLGISIASAVSPEFKGCIPLQLKNFSDKPIDIVIGEKMLNLELINPDETPMPCGIEPEHFALVKPKPSRIAEDKDFKFQNSQI